MFWTLLRPGRAHSAAANFSKRQFPSARVCKMVAADPAMRDRQTVARAVQENPLLAIEPTSAERGNNADTPRVSWPRLLLVFADRRKTAEQAMTLTIGTRTEIKRIGNAPPAAITEGDCPKAADNYRFALNILKQASESASRVERYNRTAAEIADKQLICVFTERARSERDSPGRVEKWECAASIQTCGEAMEHASLGIENIYQAMSPARSVVVLLRVLLGERHEDHPADGLNIKGGISNRCTWVRKLAEQHDICTI